MELVRNRCRRRSLVYPWVLLVLAAALAVPNVIAQSQPAVSVAVVEAEVSEWTHILNAIGSLRAAQEVIIAPEVPGRVIRIAFESGQAINAGDVLVELDSAADRAQLDDLTAQRQLAELDLRRIDKLVVERSLSEADKDTATSTLEQINARIAAQRDLISRKTLRAPFSGRLGLRQVNLGQVLSPGDEMVSLQSYQPLYVDFPVPQNSIATLAEGLPLTLRVDTFPERAFQARVSAMDARVNNATRAITVRGETLNQDESLRPGMFVTVELELGDPEPQITLPSSALIYSTFGANIFVVEERDGALAVRRIAVETGDRRGDQVAITSGLSAGDRVVANGQVRLREGSIISIDESASVFNESQLNNTVD